jgi:hypothetical protein
MLRGLANDRTLALTGAKSTLLRGLVPLILVISSAACVDVDQGESTGASVVDSSGVDSAVELAPGSAVERPVAAVELENGNVLEFFATEGTSWTGVLESVVPGNPSLLSAFPEGTPALEVFLASTPEERSVPAALLAASERAGQDAGDLVARTKRDALSGLGALAIGGIVAEPPSWCTQPNNAAFVNRFCTTGGIIDDSACYLDHVLTGGQLVAYTTDGTGLGEGGFCQQVPGSVFALQYRDVDYNCDPFGLGTWITLDSGMTDMHRSFNFNGGGGGQRQFRILRYAAINITSADVGLKWADACD